MSIPGWISADRLEGNSSSGCKKKAPGGGPGAPVGGGQALLISGPSPEGGRSHIAFNHFDVHFDQGLQILIPSAPGHGFEGQADVPTEHTRFTWTM